MLSTADTSSPVRTSFAIGWDHIARVGLTTIVASVAANVLAYFAGDTLISYDPQFLPLKNVSGVIVFTSAAAVAAVLLYAALLRFAQRPARTFTTISAIVFILTLARILRPYRASPSDRPRSSS